MKLSRLLDFLVRRPPGKRMPLRDRVLDAVGRLLKPGHTTNPSGNNRSTS